MNLGSVATAATYAMLEPVELKVLGAKVLSAEVDKTVPWHKAETLGVHTRTTAALTPLAVVVAATTAAAVVTTTAAAAVDRAMPTPTQQAASFTPKVFNLAMAK